MRPSSVLTSRYAGPDRSDTSTVEPRTARPRYESHGVGRPNSARCGCAPPSPRRYARPIRPCGGVVRRFGFSSALGPAISTVPDATVSRDDAHVGGDDQSHRSLGGRRPGVTTTRSARPPRHARPAYGKGKSAYRCRNHRTRSQRGAAAGRLERTRTATTRRTAAKAAALFGRCRRSIVRSLRYSRIFPVANRTRDGVQRSGASPCQTTPASALVSVWLICALCVNVPRSISV